MAPISTRATSLTRTTEPSGIGAQDDVGELLRRGQAALRLDGELELLVAGDRRGADPAECRLDVLALHRVDHVGRRQVECRQPVGDRARCASE